VSSWRCGTAGAHPVGLSKPTNLDTEHFTAFIEMVTHYRREGENDLAFQQLVQEVEARMQQEQAAAEREKQFEAWSEDAAARAAPAWQACGSDR